MVNAVLESMRELGSVRAIVLGAVGALMLGIFAFLSFRLSTPVYSPLYGNLSPEDSAAVVTELGSMGIDFQIGANGAEILIPGKEVLRVRMTLAQKGIPNHGSVIGYEVFDRSQALGTSSFVHNVNLLRALEGELGRTIGSLAGLKNARVHLVIPKRELFNRQQVEPTASVVLTALNNSDKLSKEQIASIRNLVASSVPGLKISRVTVVDSLGRLLARGAADESESGEVGAESAEEYRVGFENRMKNLIENMVGNVVGEGRVQAQVTADISFDRRSENSEIYDPNGQVARSVQSTEERQSSNEGGTPSVSVSGNVPDGVPQTAGGSANATERSGETTNFEISKTVKNFVSETGTVKRVSVALLVDGNYAPDAEGKNLVYTPRTDQQMEQIRTLVRSAIGFDANRGDVVEVVNMQFSQDLSIKASEGEFDWLKSDLDSILKTLVIGAVAVLAILMVIRPLALRAFEMSPADFEAQLAGGDYENVPGLENSMAAVGPQADRLDVDQIQSMVAMSSVKKVNDLVENNPEETLGVVRNWLAQK